MKILLLYRHHRRCIAGLWREQMLQMGHDIVSVGPWYEGEPFGVYGNAPDAHLDIQNHLYWYEWIDVERVLPANWRPDLTIVIGQGEQFRVFNIAGPWVHLAAEGDDTAWSAPLTASRYVNIRRAEQDGGVRWLPNGLSVLGAARELPPVVTTTRDFDFVHIATPREARRSVWAILGAERDLNTIMGEFWGGLYFDCLARACTTYVCSGQDFVTLRVFEAMAMGCLVFADSPPAMTELFEPGEHYVPFAPIAHPSDGEPMPDPDWLLGAIREWARGPRRLPIVRRAATLVRRAHTLRERVERLLREAGADWSMTWPQ